MSVTALNQPRIGIVLEVSELPTGTTALVDHVSGATALMVDDSTDFEETGGTLRIAGTTYGYSAVDIDNDTITLTTGLSADLSENDFIELMPSSTEKWALVQTDIDDDGIKARIPHTLSDRFVLGIREEDARETVMVAVELTAWTVKDIVALAPTIDGTLLAPDSVTNIQIAPDAVGNTELAPTSVSTDEIVPGTIRNEDIATGTIRSNLVPDPGFEDTYEIDFRWDPFYLGVYGVGNTMTWRWDGLPDPNVTVKKTATTVHRSRSGARALEITNGPASGTSAGVVSGAFKVEPNKTYVLSFCAASLNAGASQVISVITGGGDAGSPWYFNDLALTGDTDTWVSPPLITEPVDPNDMQEYSYRFTVPATGVTYCCLRYGNFGSGPNTTLIADDFAVVELGGVGASELTGAGLRLFGPDGLEVGAFVSNRPNYLSITFGGDTVAAIDQHGSANFQTVDIVGVDTDGDDTPDRGLTVYGKDLYDILDPLPKGTMALGYRVTSSSATTTEAPVQQLDAMLVGGRLYRVTCTGYTNQNTVGARAIVTLKRNTSGASAGTTDTLCQSHRSPTCASGTGGGTYPFQIEYWYAGGAAGAPVDASFVITTYPENGGASYVVAAGGTPCYMAIDDIGIYKGDMGIDRSGGTPPPTKKSYTSTWTASSSESYRGDNTARTDTTDLVQGYNSYNGTGHALILFASANSTGGETSKTVATALSGATLTKAEVYVYFNHWYYNSGGTAYIRANTLTSLASTTPSGTAKAVGSWGIGVGKWVDITSIFSISSRGIWLGKPPSTDLIYYGRANYQGNSSGKPQLRLTYTK